MEDKYRELHIKIREALARTAFAEYSGQATAFQHENAYSLCPATLRAMVDMLSASVCHVVREWENPKEEMRRTFEDRLLALEMSVFTKPDTTKEGGKL